jgi:hypothetical protein
MQLSDMTTEQLLRIYRRIYRKYSDIYGCDMRTLSILSESAADIITRIQKIVNKRFIDRKTDYYF